MRTTLVLAVLLVCTPTVSFAQDTPAFDVSGGYSFLRDQEIEENFHGWLVSAGGNFNDWFGIVGEVGGNYKTLDVLGSDLDLSIHSFMVGPRFAAHTNPSVTPYGQFLVGAARASGSILGESESTTELAIQPGAGVDFWVRPRLGIRVGGDYRRILVEEAGSNEFRFHAGIVLSGGSR
jgi:opacity protein-like surface antigen